MKTFLFAICVFAVGCFASQKHIIQVDEVDRERLSAALSRLNDVEDKSILDDLPNIVFDLIVSIIKNSGLDPIDLPDINLSYEQGRLTGVLDLTEGQVSGFSDITRNGDAEVNVFLIQRRANIIIPVYFERFDASYNYFTKLFLLGVNGKFTAAILGIESVLDIDINLVDMGMTLNDFTLDARRFSVRFEGNPLSDWLANILGNVMAEIARQPILDAINAAISSIFKIMFGIV